MPISDEELALIDAIHADPRNDAPRLAYADWLENDGSPLHAEFIRLQCHQPYIAISNRDPDCPRKSYNFEFPREDPTAKDRLDRLVAILPGVYRSDRYTAQRNMYYYEEHYRGLSLVEVGNEGRSWIEDSLITEIGQLSRVELTICTDDVDALLCHPIMARVDKLHIWPNLPGEAERDPDCTMNSHYDKFWAENIPVLAVSPVMDRLLELNPCGCRSTGELTEQSRKNLALCQALLEPRVFVDYSY